jgi:hypothetical protein
MKPLGDADEFSVDERRFYRLAGIREGSDFEQNLSPEPKTHPRNDQVPIDALDGDVLSDSSDVDRVSFGL